MEDKLKKLFLSFTRQYNPDHFRHLLTDDRSAGTGHLRPVARPRISLKARMLGGQAKTIMR